MYSGPWKPSVVLAVQSGQKLSLKAAAVHITECSWALNQVAVEWHHYQVFLELSPGHLMLSSPGLYTPSCLCSVLIYLSFYDHLLCPRGILRIRSEIIYTEMRTFFQDVGVFQICPKLTKFRILSASYGTYFFYWYFSADIYVTRFRTLEPIRLPCVYKLEKLQYYMQQFRGR